jgi:hypothetical protein
LSRTQAVDFLEATWARGSQAGNALRLRGELAIHLASMEDEEDGHAIIQSFLDKMDGMIIGARQAHYAFGNPTLVRYLRALLRVLRDELERLKR